MATHSIVVQIYEIQNPAEAEAMIALGVDRIGSVILSEKDWKVPAIREAVIVSKEAGVKHSLIPLFVTKEALFHSVDYYAPNIIHFCEAFADEASLKMSGEALADLQISIRERFPEIEIMRTIPVRASKREQIIPTFDVAKCFEAASDYFLVDTSLGNEPVHGFVGITGHTCDWMVARELIETSPLPVILAGGLSPQNVYEAIMEVRPFGVDSCTRTNAVDGDRRPIRFRKDKNAVRAFVKAVRQAEIDLSSGQNEPESLGGRKRL